MIAIGNNFILAQDNLGLSADLSRLSHADLNSSGMGLLGSLGFDAGPMGLRKGKRFS
jgi:hypothetical protein